MENKIIPTAKEFIQNYIEENNHDSNIDMEESMIEFAKLHVEAALKEASKSAFPDSKWDVENSYPLSNIK